MGFNFDLPEPTVTIKPRKRDFSIDNLLLFLWRSYMFWERLERIWEVINLRIRAQRATARMRLSTNIYRESV